MPKNDFLAELRQGYLSNFSSEMEEIENLVLELEKKNNFKENYDAIYRKVHSLKGSGGTYGFSIISSVCHQLEDFLTGEINEEAKVDESKINTLFAYTDILRETSDLLIEKKTSFSKIEKDLLKLKEQDKNSKLRVLIIGSLDNMYGKICSQILDTANVQYSATRTIPAIQRLIHEQFDVLITSQENQTLSGIALIAAIKLNNQNRKMKYILITSNQKLSMPIEISPEYLVIKDSGFSENLKQSIENIISAA